MLSSFSAFVTSDTFSCELLEVGGSVLDLLEIGLRETRRRKQLGSQLEGEQKKLAQRVRLNCLGGWSSRLADWFNPFSYRAKNKRER